MSRPSERETRRWLAALGAAVRDRRAALGISQETLGYRSGLDRTYVSGVERGRRNPTVVALFKLASGLEISIGELILTAEEQVAKR